MTKAMMKSRRKAVAVARELIRSRLQLVQELLLFFPGARPRSKFIVLRADGTPKPRKARYFVLRVDHHHPAGDMGNWETWCARKAVELYAHLCANGMNNLSKKSSQCREGGKAAKALLREAK